MQQIPQPTNAARTPLCNCRTVALPTAPFLAPIAYVDPNVRWWQDRLTPLWRRIGGGCHLNRAIRALIEEAGFQFDWLETGYMRGPKPMTFMYEGSARPM